MLRDPQTQCPTEEHSRTWAASLHMQERDKLLLYSQKPGITSPPRRQQLPGLVVLSWGAPVSAAR